MSTQFTNRQWRLPNNENKDKQSNYSMDFDAASSDYIYFTGLPDFGGGSLSISFWIKSGIDSSNAYVLMRSGFSFYIFQSGTASNLRYRIQTSSLNSINGGAILDNNWHHCVMTFDSTANEFKVFEDGNQVGSTVTTSGSLASSTSLVYLATFAATAPYFKSGQFDGLSFFNYALTDGTSGTVNQIAALYGSSSTGIGNPMSLSPVAFYQLGDKSAFNGANYLVPNIAAQEDDGDIATSYSPFALDFDSASSDYIDCGNVLDNIFTGSDFSVSTWIYATTNTTHNNFFNKATTVQFYLHSNKIKIYLGSSSSGIWPLESTATLSLNTWYNIIFTRSGNENKLYINASLDNSATSTSSIPSSTGSLTLSSYLGSSYFWDGSISNPSVWNTALTSSQVTELYSEGIPQNLNNHSAVSSLVSWWQLGSNSSFNTNWTVLDEKGSNNGTSVNMTEDSIVDGVGSYANGLSSGMGGDEVVGDAPYSTANSLSVNMDVLDRVTDTPS